MKKSKFTKSVIKLVRAVPRGKVVSYGQIALYAGTPRTALQVGWVLHHHGDDGITPWWRVVNNEGRISTKCIEHHANIQKNFLEKENIKVTADLKVDIEKYRWRPEPELLKEHKLSNNYIETAIDKYLV